MKRDWRKSETRQRQHLVGVRLNRDEYGVLVLTAAREGKTAGAMLRTAFLEYAARREVTP